MTDNKKNYIIESNLTYAWGRAISLLMERGISEIQPLIVTVNGCRNNRPLEDEEIRLEIDSLLLERGKFSSQTVANTIFPKSLWSKTQHRSLLYSRFNKILPNILEHDMVGKRYGRYFNRMINYGSKTKKRCNQVEYILSTIERGNPRRSAYQISIIDPFVDHTNQHVRGFPCLQQIAISPLKGNGLSVTGFYPLQYIFDRAYGNYLGLCWFGEFIAHELGLEFREMTCISGIAKLGSRVKKTDSKLVRIKNSINERLAQND